MTVVFSDIRRAGRGTVRIALSTAAAALCLASGAHAHFLWQRIESGERPRVALTFGEKPDERISAVPIDRLGSARAWWRGGATIDLKPDSGVLAAPLPTGERLAGAAHSWGIVDRVGDGTGAFLLEYYAKAAASLTDADEAVELPFEIFARADGTGIVAVVRRGKSSVAGASFELQTPSGETLDRTTDANGEVRIDGRETGMYGMRARWIEARSGDVDGKRFGEVRHYTTLSCEVADGSGGASVPAAAKTAAGAPAKADPRAYALLEAAHDSRQVMPSDYPGFRCELTYREGDKAYSGTLVYRKKGETDVHIEGLDEAGVKWVRDQLLNLTGHRRGGPFAEGDGKYPLELAVDDDNPYGQLIYVHDKTDSRYRVKDQKVTEVTRTMEGSTFTISVIDTMEGDAGKYLANHFVVSYRDPETGALQKVDGYRDSYEHVDGIWLPTMRTVIGVADKPSPLVRVIRLRKHQSLAKSAQ